MARDTAPKPEPVDVSGYVTDAAHAIPVAGLLADQPELLGAKRTPDEWQQLLDAYLTSPRPAVGGVQPDETPDDAVAADGDAAA